MRCESPIDWPTQHIGNKRPQKREGRALTVRVVQVYQTVQVEPYLVANIQAIYDEERCCIRVIEE